MPLLKPGVVLLARVKRRNGRRQDAGFDSDPPAA
jgi:hypothetical protein